MSKNKKSIFAILLCLALAFTALAGCGDSTPDTDKDPDPGTKQPVTHEYVAEFGNASYLLAKSDGVDTASISATLKCDGSTVTTVTPTYSVADAAVATLSNGVITAVAAGETTVTATYSENDEVLATATAKISVLEEVDSDKVNSFDESAMNIYGRTYFNERGRNRTLVLENACTGLEVAFVGTELSIDVTGENKLRVYIDGSTEGKDLVFSNKTTLTVCEKLTKGIHVVRILKATSTIFNSVSIYEDSLTTDGTFLKPPAKSALKIEVIGDSITAGCGSVGGGTAQTIANTDATQTYAFLAVQAFDADFSVMALEGVCTKDGTTNAYGFYTKMSTNNNTAYDPTLFDADIVIVGLGENDMWHATASQFDYTVEQFRQDYADFLRLIRASHPDAYIVCAYGMMPAASTVQAANTIKGAIADTGDDKISSVAMMSDDKGGNSHPSANAHIANSKTLTKHIAAILEK